MKSSLLRFVFVGLFVFCLAGISMTTAQDTTTNLQILRKIDHARFYAYPNGWGSTPAAARRDLDRVMEIYKDRPGYYRYSYVRIVPVSKTQCEADGCVSFFAPDALIPRPVKGMDAMH